MESDENAKNKTTYATAENWHWIITREDIEKIYENCRETINRVYFANLSKFGRIANKYITMRQAQGIYIDRSVAEDIKQQIYIDLPYYNFENVLTLFCDIRRTCGNVALGRSAFGESLDSAAWDNEKSTADESKFDRYLCDDSAEAALELEESEKRVIKAVAEQKALTERQRDILTAVALKVRAYRGIFAYELFRAFGGALQ